MFWKTCEGSSERLLQLCFGYFVTYIGTGVLVKYFTGKAALGYPGMGEVEYLVYSTAGGSAICLAVVLALGWYRMKSSHNVKVLGREMPAEFLYIIPSGVCTAVVIPTTTLMYLLPISVMVAMTIMRASIIIISRLIDAALIKQGILKRKVYPEENIAVALAMVAACIQLFWVKPGDFDFVHSPAAVIILASYIVAYGIRLYIMNYYKNTRPKGVPQDNKGFFAIEQIAACITMIAVCAALFYYPRCPQTCGPVGLFRTAVASPHTMWGWAVIAGGVYGIGAFFSVFIFMFKGRTATFAVLANRLTSLVAGTAATLITWSAFGGKPPKASDWIALLFVFTAVHFLSLAEKKRVAELAAAQEINKVC